MDYVKGSVKGLAKSLGAGDMDMKQLMTQGVNLGKHWPSTFIIHNYCSRRAAHSCPNVSLKELLPMHKHQLTFRPSYLQALSSQQP